MDAKDAQTGDMPLPPPRGGREYLELWISLSRRDWGSVVLIPADRDGSTAEMASALAEVGQRLSYDPVTAITVSSLEYGSALALADLQQHLDRDRRGRAHASAPVPTEIMAAVAPGGAEKAEPGEQRDGQAGEVHRTEALLVLPPARVIISVPPVISEPLGLAAAQRADAVVLAVRMNRSRMAEVRRTIELVGRDHVMGCFIVQ